MGSTVIITGLSADVAQALVALSTNHEAWRELVRGYQLDWDPAEQWLVDALSRALLARQPKKNATANQPARAPNRSSATSVTTAPVG